MTNRSGRHVAIVRHVVRILDSDSPGSQVKRVLRRYLNRLVQQAPRRGRGAHTGHFIDHLVKLANSYWPGSFHTYDHPEIPRTSNGIEGFFGSIKRSLRSTSGRASTAGGTMETCGEFAVRAQALARTMPKATLDTLLEAVPNTAFATRKQQLLRIRAPARERRSIQRDLGAFLERALAVWREPIMSD
ncbi:MAG: hypothetical protein ACRD1P_07920 [Thermoanaerobaculia bacterium]